MVEVEVEQATEVGQTVGASARSEKKESTRCAVHGATAGGYS